ncbi:short-chain dehydrogenase/reductase [Mycena maculata]|uniref:Short-chain dehydrogenase/reductase n=1 Tax=Mycena maculata TaxID=230809 RepID=A0AAD7HRI9_9AGAR|nr:short-chain dehydrogenase/reductase [Mycena maculata]
MPSRTRTVFITGCGPFGIGSALATEFHMRGHRVIASGREASRLTGLKDLGIETLVMDVTSQDSIDAAVAHVRTLTDSKLDILINNAGRNLVLPFTDTSLDDARRVFDINFFGLFAVTRAFLPMLLGAEGTSIVANMGSVNEIFCPPFFSVYSASKAAVEILGTTIRKELAPLGVRVVTLKTGSVHSNLFKNALPTKLPEDSLYASMKDFIERRSMLEQGRFVAPEAYAKAVVTQLLRPSVKHIIWRGGLSTVAWVMSWFGWEGMIDRQMIKGYGLDKVPSHGRKYAS